MATGLLNNANSSLNMSAEAVSPDGTETAIEALSMTLSPTGGREMRGQLFVTVPPADVTDLYTTAQAPLYLDGVTPAAYSDGTILLNYWIRTPATAEAQTARVDFVATLNDQAFEEYNIFGGPRDERSDRGAVRF